MKWCKYCESNKPTTKRWVGLRCFDCEAERKRQWAKKNAEHVKAKRKEKYWKDPGNAKREAKEWYESNTDRALEQRRSYWHANKERNNEMQREYYRKNAKEITRKEHERYISDPEYRFRKIEAATRWKNENYEARREYERKYAKNPKVRRRNTVGQKTRRAIARGELVKPDMCYLCDANNDLEPHHLSYDRDDSYRDIVWLCRPCHYRFHSLEKQTKKRESD